LGNTAHACTGLATSFEIPPRSSRSATCSI
jgi:hypothetical protein